MTASKAPQVVIAYMDRRRVRGYVFDFFPSRDRFRVFPSPAAKIAEAKEVLLQELKAIFFLQENAGDGATITTSPGRRRLEVRFQDGERLEGTTEGYSKDRLGFFMAPEDPTGKIIRVFVVNANVKEVKWLPAQMGAPALKPNFTS